MDISALVKRWGRRMDKKLQLQSLRAIAASLVVIDHAISNEIRHGLLSPTLFPIAWYVGWMGVAYFFVTSGYIMLTTSERKFGQVASSWDFVWRRVARIVPMYWIATLVTFVLERHSHTIPDLIRSLLFIPYHHSVDGSQLLRPVVFQGWTLNMEMYFYAIFAACLALPRRCGVGLMLGALVAAVAAGFAIRGTHYVEPTTLLAFYTDPLLLLFGTGVTMKLFEKGHHASIPWAVALTLGLLATSIDVFDTTHLPFPMPITWQTLFAVISILTVWICVAGKNPNTASPSHLLVKAGDASYSTYLLHLLLIYRVLDHVGPLLRSPWLFVVVAVILSNLVGFSAYKLIEHPLYLRLKDLKWRRGAFSLQPADSGVVT